MRRMKKTAIPIHLKCGSASRLHSHSLQLLSALLFQNLIVLQAFIMACLIMESPFYIRAVYSSVQLLKKYITYYRNASNGKGHGMHSPFVFDFILHVLNNKSGYQPPHQLERLRKQLQRDDTVLTIEDLGAGSRVQAAKQKTIRQIVRTAVKPKKYSQLLFRMVKHYQPQTILELGTSLGLSTAYMAAANPAATTITIEGSAEIQQQAQKNFNALNMGFIKSLPGSFDNLLPQVLQTVSQIDLAYIDGNHRLQPTLTYFEQLLQKRTDRSVFIFDDIHWSAEMEEAWHTIKQHPDVRYTIDLFFLGLVFFRPEFKIKQHFSIRF
jgi:predicted O-methyltransferase YrrM